MCVEHIVFITLVPLRVPACNTHSFRTHRLIPYTYRRTIRYRTIRNDTTLNPVGLSPLDKGGYYASSQCRNIHRSQLQNSDLPFHKRGQTIQMLLLWLFVVSRIQRFGCQPEKTTLHGGQSRSWSAEQGKENKIRSLAAYLPPQPPHCSLGGK